MGILLLSLLSLVTEKYICIADLIPLYQEYIILRILYTLGYTKSQFLKCGIVPGFCKSDHICNIFWVLVLICYTVTLDLSGNFQWQVVKHAPPNELLKALVFQCKKFYSSVYILCHNGSCLSTNTRL